MIKLFGIKIYNKKEKEKRKLELEQKQLEQAKIAKQNAKEQRLQMVEKREKEYEDSYIKCCEECKSGNIAYMYLMAECFYDKMLDDTKKFLWIYLENPEEKIIFNQFSSLISKEQTQLEAYATWIVRAAFYGDEKALKIYQKYPNIEKISYLNMDFYTKECKKSFWTTDKLREMGFIGLDTFMKDCKLSFCKKSKIYELSYVSYYCPRDEDGFGEEIEYDEIYYDEFFVRIKKLGA